jgi:hypothetical protein
MRLKGIEFVETSDSKTVVITIERLRFNESRLPDRTQTITYAQYEVNLAAAMLLMPRNASYLYEITTGGAEIEYAFVVKGSRDEKSLLDVLIRDRRAAEYATCSNARIQNVFGGVQRADFLANDDMARRCRNSASISIDDLRRLVYGEIAETISKMEPLSRAQFLNE